MESARVLRPGGLFLSGEWIRDMFMEDGSRVDLRAPGAYRFTVRLWEIMIARGISYITPLIPTYLQMSRQFDGVILQQYKVVLNSHFNNALQNDISNRMKDVMVKYARAMKPLFLDSGMLRGEAETVIEGYVRDARQVQGLMVVFQTVYARKA